MRSTRLLFAAALTVCCAACAVGPDFETPAKPATNGYDSSPLPPTTDQAGQDNAGAAQSFDVGKDIPAEWWKLYHSEPLDQLIAKAIKSNPDLAAAQASLRVAEENYKAGEGALFPTVQGSFATSRQKVPGAAYGGSFPSLIYTLHNASVGVSYGLDIWGGTRRQIEELEAQKDYQRFLTEATYISLTANVVTAAIQEASLRGQIAATEEIVEEEGKQRDVLQKQLDLGGATRAALLAQEATLAQVRATLPPLEKQLAQIRHELSVLAGQFPSEAPAGSFELSSLQLPSALPVALPSLLVEQRPDVRAAEASLHAASAAIGVAISNRLPQITLSADIGTEASSLSKLFSPGTGLWSLGFDGTQTLFDAGTLRHQQGAAEAQYDVAAAQYRKTVLAAFQDVADTLRALQSDATALKAQRASEKAAGENLKLAHTQFDAGSISYITLLDAERTEQQAKIALVQAEAQRFADTAALFQALGGGWWNRAPDATETASASQETDEQPHSAQASRSE